MVEKELYLRELKEKLQQTSVQLLPSFALPPEVERGLTPREREVLELLLVGLTNEEIATKLSLSIETVKTHRRNLYRKLSVKNPRKFLRKLRNHPFKSDIHF
ncbi:MAG: LuxR C-terminal-related transcriptional regulator [Candidatus Methanomethyliaceae archaeon]